LYGRTDGADQNDRGDDRHPGGDASATGRERTAYTRRFDATADIDGSHARNSTGSAVRDPPSQASRCLEGGSSPYVHSTVLGLCGFVNQVTIPSRSAARSRYSNRTKDN
jgi:hypothetical protein